MNPRKLLKQYAANLNKQVFDSCHIRWIEIR